MQDVFYPGEAKGNRGSTVDGIIGVQKSEGCFLRGFPRTAKQGPEGTCSKIEQNIKKFQ